MKLSGVYIVLILILFAKVNFAQEKEKKDTLIVTRTVIVDGVKKNLQRRKYCLECSPFGHHNTVSLEKYPDGF